MRIIKEKTLFNYVNQDRYKAASEAVESWILEVRSFRWTNPAELRSHYGSASFIGKNRVVFNIKGNEFRLIVDILYRVGIVYIIWFGTHAEYNRINAKTISYGD
jgi:mRNA interferase HigB